MNYHSRTNASDFKGLPINTGSSGGYFCYDIILQKMYERIEYMTEKHTKVFFIRIDLEFTDNCWHDNSNNQISHLFKILNENFTNREFDFHYVWVREQSREKHQHYHAMLLLNLAKKKDCEEVVKEIGSIWERLIGCKGGVHFCNKDRYGDPVENGIMICRPSSIAQGEIRSQQEREFLEAKERCFRWASYLAKVNQKSNTPEGMRRFGASQLPGSYSRFQFTIPVSI